MGLGDKYKDNFGKLRKYCIEVAIKEINEKTELLMDYKTHKVGRKITHIELSILKKRRKKIISLF